MGCAGGRPDWLVEGRLAGSPGPGASGLTCSRRYNFNREISGAVVPALQHACTKGLHGCENHTAQSTRTSAAGTAAAGLRRCARSVRPRGPCWRLQLCACGAWPGRAVSRAPMSGPGSPGTCGGTSPSACRTPCARPRPPRAQSRPFTYDMLSFQPRALAHTQARERMVGLLQDRRSQRQMPHRFMSFFSSALPRFSLRASASAWMGLGGEHGLHHSAFVGKWARRSRHAPRKPQGISEKQLAGDWVTSSFCCLRMEIVCACARS